MDADRGGRVKIRAASAAELETVRELWEEFNAVLAEPDWRAHSWEEVRESVEANVRDGRFLVAEDVGEVLGYVQLALHSPRLGWIHDLYVRERARRRGVGTALLVEAAAVLRARGVETMGLEVNDSNAGARALYDGLGFTAFSRSLAVPLDELERRAGAEPAGETFGALHVRTEEPGPVERGVQQFLPRLGRSQETRVSGPRNGWVSVYDELCDREPKLLRRLARELSDRLGAVVLSLGVEEGAVARGILFDRGTIADEYASVPEYFGPLPPGDVIALAANPRVAERLAGADAVLLRAAAPTAHSPRELPPPDVIVARIAEAFGIAARLRLAEARAEG
jgi:ribosomal protein S18 acetylase RimI-like enzyme